MCIGSSTILHGLFKTIRSSVHGQQKNVQAPQLQDQGSESGRHTRRSRGVPSGGVSVSSSSSSSSSKHQDRGAQQRTLVGKALEFAQLLVQLVHDRHSVVSMHAVLTLCEILAILSADPDAPWYFSLPARQQDSVVEKVHSFLLTRQPEDSHPGEAEHDSLTSSQMQELKTNVLSAIGLVGPASR